MTATHVLHVSQATDYGVARSVTDLAAGQIEAGWRVTVACPTDGALAGAVAAAGGEHRPWPATRNPGPTVVREVAALERVVSAAAPDVVHLHSSKAGLAGRAAVRRSRPTIFQPHAWSFLSGPPVMRALARRWERHAARWSDAIVCVSRGERRVGEQAGIAGPWHVVPNAVDVDRFPVAEENERAVHRRRLGLDAGPLVVCVGRLCPQKGQDVLLDAWPAVLAAVSDAHLVLVGDGPDRPAIEHRRRPHVRLVGAHHDVQPWLCAADVVVLPSRYEGMALTMLEAMAVGRSVVATAIDGARDALGPEGGITAGALVTAGDPAGLAVSIIRRLREPALAAAEGREGRRRVETRYDVRRSRQQVAAVVADVLDRAPLKPKRKRDH